MKLALQGIRSICQWSSLSNDIDDAERFGTSDQKTSGKNLKKLCWTMVQWNHGRQLKNVQMHWIQYFMPLFVSEKTVFQISVAVRSQWTKVNVSTTKNTVRSCFDGINIIRLYRHVTTDEIWIQRSRIESIGGWVGNNGRKPSETREDTTIGSNRFWQVFFFFFGARMLVTWYLSTIRRKQKPFIGNNNIIWPIKRRNRKDTEPRVVMKIMCFHRTRALCQR